MGHVQRKNAASPSGSSEGQSGVAGRKRKRSQIQSENTAPDSSLPPVTTPTTSSGSSMQGVGQSSSVVGAGSSDVMGGSSNLSSVIKSVADYYSRNVADVKKVAERMLHEGKQVTLGTLLDECDLAKNTSQSLVGTSGSETQEDSSYTSLPTTTLESSSRNVRPSVPSLPSLPPPTNGIARSPHRPQIPKNHPPPTRTNSTTSRRQGNTPSEDEDVVDGPLTSQHPRTSYSDDIETDSCQERSYVDGVAPSCMARSHSEEHQWMPETSSLSTSRPTAGTSSRPTASMSQRKSSSVSSASLSSASSQHKLSSAQSEKSDEEQAKVQWAESTYLGESELSKSADAEKSSSKYNEDATLYKSLDGESTHLSEDDTSSKSSDRTVALRSKEAEFLHQLLSLVQKEHELLSRNRQCIECSSKQREVTFLPCGHFTTCSACAEPIFTCRLCKKRILGTVTTYLS